MSLPFIHEDFLLEGTRARELYHEYARQMPILDYHCHLSPEQIADDRPFQNITELWLEGDHYKWRAMRANGVPEYYCTGSASDWEKFEKWAETVPCLLRNPLYHWTHLELKRYFGIDTLLSIKTAREIYENCNAQLQRPEFSPRGLIQRSNVTLICTTDDPIDSLEPHGRVAADPTCPMRMLPAWRPDRSMAIENTEVFNAWVDRLAAITDLDIKNFTRFMEALHQRHAWFHQMGCRLSDHGLDTAYAEDYSDHEIQAIFAKVRAGANPDPGEMVKFKSAMLYEFAVMDASRGWAQQYHLGALRAINSRLGATVGPVGGIDGIGDFEQGRPLARLLDRLDREGCLPKTILYNLNPGDFYLFATILGAFQDGSIPGKMQLGSAWWFLDQIDGISLQIEALSQVGLLSRFIGMLTDSRSLVSYSRHEYFRRLLCNLLGGEIDRGLIPRDMDLVGNMVRDICYNNAVRYLDFPAATVPESVTSSGIVPAETQV